MATTVPLERVPNFRDLGGFSVCDKSGDVVAKVKSGRIFRSARPIHASSQDIEKIVRVMDVKTIIDLRTSDEIKKDVKPQILEHFQKPKTVKTIDRVKRRALPFTGALATLLLSVVYGKKDLIPKLPSNVLPFALASLAYWLLAYIANARKTRVQEKESSTKKPNGRRYAPVSIADNNFLRRGVLGLAPISVKLSFVFWVLMGRKDKAAYVVTTKCISKWTLSEFYNRLLQYSEPQIAKCMDLFADEKNYPIIFHCTHGKDRTGVIAALILGCLGVSIDDIAADYAISSQHPLPAEDAGNRAPPGMTREHFERVFLSASPETIRTTMAHIDKIYGSIPAYLESIGFHRMKQEQMRRLMLEHI
eukprot:TRINITY_DN6139_c0_g1_i1.p1 TRINITY_DN6139_c0_g1~~TRINITY_DN6139_c0_g1_i1.p1  ORF type:complete len:362 (+),score=80.98 TRINITY_DN6139_c0_g1_i1:49-1134(+)